MNNAVLIGIGFVLMMIGINNLSPVGWVVWGAGVAMWTTVAWRLAKRRVS